MEGTLGALTVVIPTHGGAADTRACLQALAAQVDAPPFDVVVVDDEGPEPQATDAACRAFRSLRVEVVRRDRRGGFAAAVNTGCRASTSRDLLILNNDTRPARRLVAELLAARGSRPGDVAIVGAVSNRVKGRAMIRVGDGGREAENRARVERSLAAAPIAEDVDVLSGLCMLIDRRTLDRLGGFDERFGSGNWEDDDLCLRARREGKRLLIARRAFVHHEGHRTFRALGLDPRQEVSRRYETFRQKWLNDPIGRAVLALHAGDLSAAQAAAHEAEATWPQWPERHLIDAQVSLEARDAVGARDALDRFISICPLHAGSRLMLARCSLVLGQHEAAARTLSWTARNCWVDEPQSRILAELASRIQTTWATPQTVETPPATLPSPR